MIYYTSYIICFVIVHIRKYVLYVPNCILYKLDIVCYIQHITLRIVCYLIYIESVTEYGPHFSIKIRLFYDINHREYVICSTDPYTVRLSFSIHIYNNMYLIRCPARSSWTT